MATSTDTDTETKWMTINLLDCEYELLVQTVADMVELNWGGLKNWPRGDPGSDEEADYEEARQFTERQEVLLDTIKKEGGYEDEGQNSQDG